MSVAYATTAKNARLAAGLTAVVSGQSVDGNTGFGELVIGTSALSGATGVLATITLQKPSFSIASGVATLLGVPLSATASATGTAAKAELRDSSGATIISGLTVGTSASDINLNSTAISSGQTVTVTSGTITTV
jgi:hypothetical protein